MNSIQFQLTPCKRCGENYSILNSFLTGKEMQDILNEYGDVCSSCLTEDEVDYIISTQYNTLMKRISCSAGGTGTSIYIDKLNELTKYLKGI